MPPSGKLSFLAPALSGPKLSMVPTAVPKGGGALVVLTGFSVRGVNILVPGFALLVQLTDGKTGDHISCLVLYLHPNKRDDILDTVSSHLPSNEPCYLMGDLNFEHESPRNEHEHLLLASPRTVLHHFHSACIPCKHNTREKGSSADKLDFIAVPHAQLWKWELELQWSKQLSDHAFLHASRSSTIQNVAQECTPARFHNMPTAARI